MFRPRKLLALAVLGGVCFAPSFASAQDRPWIQYLDPVSQDICGLIHGANAEFVVLASSGELVKVSGPDVILADLLVDEAANVFFGDDPAGFIDFEVDADGNRALFWMTLTGPLVEIGAFDASPSVSDRVPSDIRNTGCDACPQWDNPTTCADGDGDSGDGSDGDDTGDGTSSGFPVLCGAGSGGAAMFSMVLLMAGRSRRIPRRRRLHDLARSFAG